MVELQINIESPHLTTEEPLETGTFTVETQGYY
jgi:hypothetical protein